MLQGIMLTNYFIDLLFFLILMFNFDLSKYKPLLLFILILHFIVDRFENKFFIDNGKYKIAIENYETKYSSPEKKMLALFAIILFFSSTAFFIWIGIKIGMKNS
jgi:hypothetical protein